ncbi:putative tetratricopeptide-like helical domain superfamily [Plasmopara halstedii]
MRRQLFPLTLQRRCTFSVAAMDWRQVVSNYRCKENDKNVSLSKKDVEHVVRVCTQNDRAREAMDVVHRAEKRGILTPFDSHIQICCSWARKGKPERALSMIPRLYNQYTKEFQKLTSNQSTVYDPLLSVFKSLGDWRSTYAAIEQMHKLKITPSLRAFQVLMLTAAKARQTNLVMTTIEFVEKKFPNSLNEVATLTAMCQALLSLGDYQRVMEIYNKMDDNWASEEANTILFNQFLSAAIRCEDRTVRSKYEKLSNFHLAMTILDRMRESQQAKPDDYTFATFMMELTKRGEWAQVLDLFEIMLHAEESNRNTAIKTEKKSVISALSCSAVIRALHNVHRVNESEDFKTKERPNDKRAPLRSTNAQKRKLSHDLAIVLRLLGTVDLRNINHVSTLIDTLDEFKLFIPARQVFRRVMDQRSIHETQWRYRDGYNIDLHGLSKGVGKCAIVSTLEEIKLAHKERSDGAGPEIAPLQDLRIITGVGKRSQVFMKPVLRQALIDLLTKSCHPPLWPSINPTNPGVMLVRQDALRKWLAKGGIIRYS